jgi:hypothetical protein
VNTCLSPVPGAAQHFFSDALQTPTLCVGYGKSCALHRVRDKLAANAPMSPP